MRSILAPFFLSIASIWSSTLLAQGMSQEPLVGDKTIPENSAKTLPGDAILPEVAVDLTRILDQSQLMQALDKKSEEQKVTSTVESTEESASIAIEKAAQEAKIIADKADIEPDTTAVNELNKMISMMSGSSSQINALQPPSGIQVKKLRNSAQSIKTDRKPQRTKTGVYLFEANNRYIENESFGEVVPVPQGSIAVVKTIDGIAAEIGPTGNISMVVETAFLGPNGTFVDLKGCRIELLVTGRANKSTIMALESNSKNASISCRADDGSIFTTTMFTKIIDPANEYQGGQGRVVHNGQWKKMGLQFLNDGIKAYGAAMAAAQVTTSIGGGSGDNEPVKGATVSGSRDQYMLGQTIKGATGKFLNNIIDFYGSMSPTIDMEPGKTLYLYIRKNTFVPRVFFRFPKAARLANTFNDPKHKVMEKWFRSKN